MNTYEYEKAKQQNETTRLGNELIAKIQPFCEQLKFKKDNRLTVRSEKLIAHILDEYRNIKSVRWVTLTQSNYSDYFTLEISLYGSFVVGGEEHGKAIYTNETYYTDKNDQGFYDFSRCLANPRKLYDLEGMADAKKRVIELKDQMSALAKEINELRSKHGLAIKYVSEHF